MAEPHLCHAHDCPRRVPPSLLFCRDHWYRTRVVIQRAIWREYRRGQEVDKRPSFRYLAVQQRAIAELVYHPRDPGAVRLAAPYLARSEEWRQRAIEAGQGDPMAGISPHAAIDGQAAKDAWLASRPPRRRSL